VDPWQKLKDLGWGVVQRASGAPNDIRIDDAQPVWRYLPFDRFLWLLEAKQLWLSRADLLGDDWEVVLSKNDLDSMLNAGYGDGKRDVLLRVLSVERITNFVNCWSAQTDESYALWLLYCGEKSGVAIQTTIGRLKASVQEPVSVRPVVYSHDAPIQADKHHPFFEDVVVRKRPMFAYEHEVRIIQWKNNSKEQPALTVPWDPNEILEHVWVHPRADASFFESVRTAVRRFAPALSDSVRWSEMTTAPAARGLWARGER
jgi:hypothetical protein